MKRIIIPAFLLVGSLIAGFAAASPERCVSEKAEAASESTASKEKTTSPKKVDTITLTDYSSPVYEGFYKPDAVINDDSIIIKYMGKKQTIPNTREYDPRDTMLAPTAVVDDFNFDGSPDLFFRFRNGKYNTGDYWLWDKEKEEFVFAEGYSLEDGKSYIMQTDHSNKTLMLDVPAGAKNARKLVFRCENNTLVPVSMTISTPLNPTSQVQSFSTYDFDENGDIILNSSYQRNWYSGIKTDNNINEGYLRVTDQSVQYMKGSSIAQVMSFAEIFGADVMLEPKQVIPGVKEEKYGINLFYTDLDQDGLKDLCIHLEPQSEGDIDRYVYYFMNKRTGLFTKNAALSAENKLYIYDVNEKCLITKVSEESEKGSSAYNYYKWSKDKAVLFKRTEIKRDEENNRVMKIFAYDEKGNETEVE